jgi:hypothetical protein
MQQWSLEKTSRLDKQYESLPRGRGGQRGRSLGDRRGGGAQGGEDLLTISTLGLPAIRKMENYEIMT